MNRTKIEWTNRTWNPITGCEHNCWFCYAKKLCLRFPKNFPNGFKPTFWPDRLREPWESKKPYKIFVCSIADLWASWTPSLWRNAVLNSMRTCPVEHQFQTLTKDPQLIPKDVKYPQNWWFLATVTEQRETWKIDEIRKVNAGILGVCFEPLLGPIEADLEGIDWVIIGKLTGSRKVKLEWDWIKDIVLEATLHEIPVFMKNNIKQSYPDNVLVQNFPVVIE